MLASRVEEMRSQCERFIDDRAAELHREIQGVPLGVLRMQIAPPIFKNCPCAAVLNLHSKENAA
jgi:hypothetical protein